MELQKEDLQFIVAKLPAPVRHLMEDKGSKLMLGGGFIRACIAHEDPSDIDLFSPSEDAAVAASNELVVGLGGETEVIRITTDNAITIRAKGRNMRPIQFIHRWTFAYPSLMIDSFDFTIAKAGVWYLPELRQDQTILSAAGWRSICDDRFYADLAAKRLVYTSPVREEEPGGSMLRVLKFLQRGYRISLESLAAVMARMINALPWGEQDEATTLGVSFENWYAIQLKKQLRDVDPLVDPGHVYHD